MMTRKENGAQCQNILVHVCSICVHTFNCIRRQGIPAMCVHVGTSTVDVGMLCMNCSVYLVIQVFD